MLLEESGVHVGRAHQTISARLADAQVAEQLGVCLLYTSDAADERSSVDLGGRRIITKKNRLVLGGGGIMSR